LSVPHPKFCGASFQRGNLPFSQPFAQRPLTRDRPGASPPTSPSCRSCCARP